RPGARIPESESRLTPLHPLPGCGGGFGSWSFPSRPARRRQDETRAPATHVDTTFDAIADAGSNPDLIMGSECETPSTLDRRTRRGKWSADTTAHQSRRSARPAAVTLFASGGRTHQYVRTLEGVPR